MSRFSFFSFFSVLLNVSVRFNASVSVIGGSRPSAAESRLGAQFGQLLKKMGKVKHTSGSCRSIARILLRCELFQILCTQTDITGQASLSNLKVPQALGRNINYAETKL